VIARTRVRTSSVKRLVTAALAALVAAGSAQAVDLYVPGSDNDPHVRSADFLIGDQRYFSAAAELLQQLGEQPDRQLAPAFYRRLAEATLSFGMQQRADTIYRELGANSTDPVALARARIRVAEFLYQRGHYDEAIQDLNALRPGLPKAAILEWQDTLGRALLAQGRYTDAAQVLLEIKDAGPQRAYTRFNLGVALINDSKAPQGINVLDRIGQMAAKDDDDLAIRDKANLALGYHFLRQQQGGTAVPVFERIRSDGPLSNRALLGLGWAYLAPTGNRQKKQAVGDEVPNELNAFKSFSTIGVLLRPGFLDDDIYRRAGLRSFRLSKASQEEEAALKRALVPWIELVSRDPRDPAVQEGLLAIPYTLDRLGAHIQAQEFYERAIEALEAGRKRIDETTTYVRSGRMITTMVRRTADAESGWTWELKDLPDAQETDFLQTLISENRFQEPLKNYRDSLLMRRNLEAWSARIDELQASYAKREQPAVPADVLVTRQLERGAADDAADLPVVATPPVELKAAEDLTVPDAPATPAPTPESAVALQTSETPPPTAFDGIFERLQKIEDRIAAVRPKVSAAADQQAKLIEKLALDDLAEQRRTTEKYLIEARFALARIYDRNLKGDTQ